MQNNFQSFIKILKHPVKFRMFLFLQVPAAFFSGLKVEHADDHSCSISVPYKWFNRNPFRSTYFATLAMAAEMSTGALAMGYVYKLKPAVSLLVTKIEGRFVKKAVSKTSFTCNDGRAFETAVSAALSTGEAQLVKAIATGTNSSGEIVAEFEITWSFKKKSIPKE
jgi:hypothetical protein